MGNVCANVIVNDEWSIFLTDDTEVHRLSLWKSVSSVRTKKLNRIVASIPIAIGTTQGKLNIITAAGYQIISFKFVSYISSERHTCKSNIPQFFF